MALVLPLKPSQSERNNKHKTVKLQYIFIVVHILLTRNSFTIMAFYTIALLPPKVNAQAPFITLYLTRGPAL